MLDTVTFLGAPPSPTDVACAEEVKPLIFAAAGSTVGFLGAGLFGTYKLFKGRPAAGVTSLVAAGILWFVGNRFAHAAATGFTSCRHQP